MTTQPDPYQRPTDPPGGAATPPAPADAAPAGPVDAAPAGPVQAAPTGAAPPDWATSPGAQPPATGARTLRPWLLAGVAGAVIGALVVGILWAASSFVGGDSGEGADAAEDAAAACGVFARVPDGWTRETLTEANTYQLGGAIALARSAGQRDPAYQALADQAQQVQQAVVSLNIERVEQLVVDVRNTCDEL